MIKKLNRFENDLNDIQRDPKVIQSDSNRFKRIQFDPKYFFK